jgi:hypothetical protein
MGAVPSTRRVLFRSMPPRGGRADIVDGTKATSVTSVSIHGPGVRGDSSQLPIRRAGVGFNPRSPHRGATRAPASWYSPSTLQSTLSVGERSADRSHHNHIHHRFGPAIL